jgi:DnaJ homolog subfamily C member 3
MRLFALSVLLVAAVDAASADSSGLYPPGLLPLIDHANTLLSSGQFNEATKAYTEAIGQCAPSISPSMLTCKNHVLS